ncbi:hypothetical protein [Streptomyces sp. 4F14]|uniref:hypothetical protein n=1 Tax=Streptomyces sp. 4F14 TaxID=3394380 RepID=UPI003A8B4554
MKIRTPLRALLPLGALAASALVTLSPVPAAASTPLAAPAAAPSSTLVRLPAGYCCHDLRTAGDPAVKPVLDHAGLSVPADVAVGIGCHHQNFTEEQHVEECDSVPLECVADAEAGRWGLVGLGCVPAGSSPEVQHHRTRQEVAAR